MNIQPGNSNRRKKVVKTETGGGMAELYAQTAHLVQGAVVVVLLFVFGYAYLTLDRRAAECDGEIHKVRSECEELDREITQLKNEEARYSTRSHIMAQIRRFNLPLVPTDFRQTRHLSVMSAEQAARTPLRVPGEYTSARNVRGYRK